MSDFLEDRALRLAYEDSEADSGNHEPLDAFLDESFTEREVLKISEAAGVLADRAWKSLQRKRAVPPVGGGAK